MTPASTTRAPFASPVCSARLPLQGGGVITRLNGFAYTSVRATGVRAQIFDPETKKSEFKDFSFTLLEGYIPYLFQMRGTLQAIAESEETPPTVREEVSNLLACIDQKTTFQTVTIPQKFLDIWRDVIYYPEAVGKIERNGDDTPIDSWIIDGVIFHLCKEDGKYYFKVGLENYHPIRLLVDERKVKDDSWSAQNLFESIFNPAGEQYLFHPVNTDMYRLHNLVISTGVRHDISLKMDARVLKVWKSLIKTGTVSTYPLFGEMKGDSGRESISAMASYREEVFPGEVITVSLVNDEPHPWIYVKIDKRTGYGPVLCKSDFCGWKSTKKTEEITVYVGNDSRVITVSAPEE